MTALDARRTRRGRVLIVGDGVVDDAHALSPEPARAETLFDAIGAISAAPAGAPIVAALIPDSALANGDGERALEALRRVDPAVQLVRVADAMSAGAPRGFDRTVDGPVDAATLEALLDGRSPTPKPTRRPSPAPESESTPASASASPSAPVSPPAPAPATDLGDVDLVDAILKHPDGVAHVALALVRQHTGWDDAALASTDEHAGLPRDESAIEYDGETLGRLVAPSAPPAERDTWARWLAHWLALDRAYRAHRVMAFRDDLTGAWNRRYFRRFLAETMRDAARLRRTVTVMVFDIDDFKRYNDEFSHEAGDVILRETVALLRSVIRASDRVCRIGGDEFAVVFADLDAPRESGSSHPASVEAIARRFQHQVATMRFPKLGIEAPGNLSISAGLAAFPWDGNDPETLLRLADERALESKRRGKNYITFGPGA